MKHIHYNPWVKLGEAPLLSVFVRSYDQNKATQNLYVSLWGPYKACDQNGNSGSYMDAVFELVADDEPEIWTSLPHCLTKDTTALRLVEFV